MPGFVTSLFPLSRPAFSPLCAADRSVRGSRTLARWYAIPCGLCVPRARSGCPSGIPRVYFVCACACALTASAPFLPPQVGVARASRVVPVQGAGRAVPRGPYRCACPASVPCAVWLAWGGSPPGPVPLLPGMGLFAPLSAGPRVRGAPAPGGAGGGGGGCVPSSPEARPGGPEGRGVALPRSLPLPSLGGYQSGRYWRRSVHGGRGLHTAPIRVRVLMPGAVRVAPLCASAGPPACRRLCGSRRLGAWGRVAYLLSGVPPPGAAALLDGGRLPPVLEGGRGSAPL